MDADVPRKGLGGLLLGWLGRGLTAVVVALIDSITESVDSVPAMIPNPVPTAGQLRQARARGGERLRGVGRAARPARRPVLAGVGAGDLLVDRWWPAGSATA